AEVVAVLGENRLRSWGATYALAFSPDGKSLAVANPRAVRTFDTSTGQLTATLPVPMLWMTGLAYRPDGKTLAIMVPNEPLRALDIGSGKITVNRLGPTEGVPLALAPDGRSVVFSDKPGTADAKLRLWDLAENRERVVLGPAQPGQAAVFSAD